MVQFWSKSAQCENEFTPGTSIFYVAKQTLLIFENLKFFRCLGKKVARKVTTLGSEYQYKAMWLIQSFDNWMYSLGISLSVRYADDCILTICIQNHYTELVHRTQHINACVSIHRYHGSRLFILCLIHFASPFTIYQIWKFSQKWIK